MLSACAGHKAPQQAALEFPPPAPQPTPALPPEPTTPGAVRDEIYRWFSAKGYPAFQAAALVDHARTESGFRPCAAGAAGLRYTYQWAGRRLERLYEFAGMHGCPPLDKQLAFADHELRTEPNFGCFWHTETREAAVAALRRGFGRGRC